MEIVSPSDLVHPFDQSAWRELESAADLGPTVAAFSELWARHGGVESPDRWGVAARLGPDRSPDIYHLLPPICAAFGIAEPALYLAPGEVRAYALGAPAAIVLFRGLLEQLAADEVIAVLAHECGHILLHSPWHRSMALCLDPSPDLVSVLGSEVISGLAASTPPALRAAVLDWSDKSELSADRAAAAYLSDPDAITRAMFRLAGTEATGTGLAGVGAATVGAALRVREVQAWAETPGFARLVTHNATPAGAGR